MRRPWEPEEYRPAPSFSSLPQCDQDAMNARLEIVLAELRAAKPRNETAKNRPYAASETQRKAAKAGAE
jgi:hypothetical protein